ncbi:PAS domain S-box-containing protein [Desulfatibacillum alkenivorans DSM 16219]|jgi:PAS domain S-box-containing protein|uniref:histidine kinase n=1 Tax=Desulfatibacillum alkenivorans DSM 16219 TaxID=1121393 RepID=A0A1M6LZN3_9BACT|nr:PAS domain S-box protein [Desulfatibacillum alkenivorans]SHJ76614.1 PAS domain S-box-containing protein [Desulfatibacillum alkenivorans DSM 16219]
MIAIIDAFSLGFCCLAMAILIGKSKNSPLMRDQKLLLGGLILFMGVYYFCIFVKWAGITGRLEAFENFEGALIPMWWAFVFYALMNMIATNEIKESESKYRLIVENQSELILKMDPDLKIRFASPSFCRMIGKPEADVLGRPLLSILDQKGESFLPYEVFNKTVDPSQPAYFEKIVKTSQGERLLAWHLSALTREGDGKDVFIAVGRDITEKSRTEKKLASMDHRYRTLMENLPVGIFRASIEGQGRLLMVNKAAAAMLGYDSELELLKIPVSDIFSDNGQRRELIKRIKAEGVIVGVEAALRKKDGAIIFGSVTMNMIEDENNIYVDGIIENVTNVRQALNALNSSERLHRQAQLIAKVGHWEQDITTMTYEYSEGLADILKIPKNLTLDFDDVKRLIHPEDLQTVLNEFGKSVKSRTEYDMTHRYVLSDGEVKYVHSKCVHEFDADGNHTKSIGTVQDVTEIKVLESDKHNTERQLRQAQKLEAIGTLAGGIAHDFNNILTPILGFSQMLAENLPDDTRNRESAQAIYEAALRASDLVGHILTFSRQADAERMPVHVAAILKEAVKFVRASIPSTINIKQDIQTNCLPVLADPTQIHQIIMNLSTNAYYAMQEKGGELTISLKQKRRTDLFPDLEESDANGMYYLHLKVQDTGQGMDKETMDRIFDPYFTTKKRGEGTGLGLSTVIGILNQLGGRISVESKIDAGTVFNVYLPCMEKLPSAAAASSSQPAKGNGQEVLVVDDEGTVANMLSQMLKNLDYVPTAVSDSLTALELIQAAPQKFALVISDLTMPNLTGVELAKKAAELNPDLPFILSSGLGDGISGKASESPNIKDILHKPITRSALGRVVNAVLNPEN